MLIAIDGPSGSGKSSTAREVAKRLRLAYLDTGAMYRAITCAHLAAGVCDDDPAQVAEVAKSAVLAMGTDPQAPTVAVNGQDVTIEIRQPRVSSAVSRVAANSEVRQYLTKLMREYIESANHNIVVEGRDITTVVAPDADLRILLIADPTTRMNRRAAELGGGLSQEQLHDQIVRRDRDDSTVSEFMQAAEGVELIDSTDLSLDEVVTLICGMVTGDE